MALSKNNEMKYCYSTWKSRNLDIHSTGTYMSTESCYILIVPGWIPRNRASYMDMMSMQKYVISRFSQ